MHRRNSRQERAGRAGRAGVAKAARGRRRNGGAAPADDGLEFDFEAIGRRLVRIRSLLGYGIHGGQTALLRRYNVSISKASWSTYESGQARLPLQVARNIMRIPRLKGLTLDYLFFGRLEGMPAQLRAALERVDDEAE